MDRIMVILAIGTFLFYLMSRIRSLRLADSLEKRILESRSRIALGVTLIALSVNILFLSSFTAVQIIVGTIFILFGGANAIYGFKAHKHYTAQLD
ncbi:hypothetical protein JCM19046_350 [Bacillus sp. JCM 19046]|uniref:Uncharacterized membrane protein HdeD (DUF308 family) n=1 Tax=Shouchella xiaoxiensis TaxID=766895 RepID=A0ABS2SSH1_9BACI|nr:YtpI family protein [Shouchella xiaoxiensis]MBM7838459.1 uncharacterized membrane protein HdeD (DUF308 family) [Shouchella xiaoxiensis]GAF14960.1 hypothetical protein JCM19045_4299 [Bacillus sp. JCM 19045]GAF15946.1 hypothetical protein JCM19046_350 [Bacillus sp. JCM 19046]